MLVNNLKSSLLSGGTAAIIFSIGLCVVFSVLAFNSNLEASDTNTGENMKQVVVKNITSDWGQTQRSRT